MDKAEEKKQTKWLSVDKAVDLPSLPKLDVKKVKDNQGPIIVRINGIDYETCMYDGIHRFVKKYDTVVKDRQWYIQLEIDLNSHKITEQEYVEKIISGYSVDGWCDVVVDRVAIVLDNPFWTFKWLSDKAKECQHNMKQMKEDYKQIEDCHGMMDSVLVADLDDNSLPHFTKELRSFLKDYLVKLDHKEYYKYPLVKAYKRDLYNLQVADESEEKKDDQE